MRSILSPQDKIHPSNRLNRNPLLINFRETNPPKTQKKGSKPNQTQAPKKTQSPRRREDTVQLQYKLRR
jgi:hypothetical protein